MSGVRRTTAGLVVGATLGLLGACSGGDAGGGADGPADAVEAMMRALDSGSCQDVKDVVVTPSEIDCGFVGEVAGMFADEGLDVDAVEFQATDVTSDQATVVIDWNDGDPTESYEVQRVDGAWKVVFDSAA